MSAPPLAALALLLATGCVGHERFAGAEGEPLHSDPPSISEIRWDCSSSDATWTFEVDTVNWTANGNLWLAQSDDYVEKHAIRSVSAAHDGSWDELSLELDIVADWRDASSGSSTAFFCIEPVTQSLSFRVVVAARPRPTAAPGARTRSCSTASRGFRVASCCGKNRTRTASAEAERLRGPHQIPTVPLQMAAGCLKQAPSSTA
jgi:hypothetical protein